MLILFDKIGGVPRSVLLRPSKQPQRAISEGLSDIKSALQQISHPVKVNDCLRAGNEIADFSSQLIHLAPDPNNYLLENSYRTWASRYVFKVSSKCVDGISKGMCSKAFCAGSQGVSFRMFGMFQSIRAKYKYQRICGNKTGEFQIYPPSHFVTFRGMH